MKLVALKNFSWAHAGVRVEHFAKDDIITTDDADLIKVSQEEGWAGKPGKAPAAKPPAAVPENKAHIAAPENKDEPAGDAAAGDQVDAAGAAAGDQVDAAGAAGE